MGSIIFVNFNNTPQFQCHEKTVQLALHENPFSLPFTKICSACPSSETVQLSFHERPFSLPITKNRSVCPSWKIFQLARHKKPSSLSFMKKPFSSPLVPKWGGETRRNVTAKGSNFVRTMTWKMQCSKWLTSQAAAFYEESIQKLVPRYDKCLNNGGEYVEKIVWKM